ncbi:DUF1156 domain-containing protein [Rhodococcus erythropolis]
MTARKLIEVALPLEAINRASAREKEPFTKRHPRALHIWWARRPLTAARAILFAQLVDDPSSHPEEFPTEELQRKERVRLHEIIERLVIWENSWNDKLFEEAHAEIIKSTNGSPPVIYDPFAGGGTIPLEAQRLGLITKASDLNPVAVLINKALIELPPKFRDMPPVFPGLADSEIRSWRGAEGLVADIRAYGHKLREQAHRNIGHLYPNIGDHRVIGWVWARTVTCPNPACQIDMPLVRSWWLSKKKNKEHYIKPNIIRDPIHPSGLRVVFEIVKGTPSDPNDANEGTVSGRTGAICLSCQSTASVEYLRIQGKGGKTGRVLLATVASGERQRIYFPATPEHTRAAEVPAPAESISGEMADNPRWFSPPGYGLTDFEDVFTPRQLVALTEFSDLVVDLRKRVISDGGSTEYADAIATYLGLAVSRYADLSNALCSWNHTNENIRALFSRQAVPMTWDFVEANVFGSIGLDGPIESICNSLHLGIGPAGTAVQMSASAANFEGTIISTDPPYYDNIGYSDLSDFFYVWLRRSLRQVHPELLATLLVPKADELVANPYRHEGKSGAKKFFEDGFREVFNRARNSASSKFPITVYYAFKQSESDASGEASTGWETLLEGMIRSGWEITSTWPIRSERSARSVGLKTNALASSIILSLRPRKENSPITDRRGFIAALENELPDALRNLQQGRISPVDLPQSAIGPGMSVFSRYDGVLEPDGNKMTVRSALARINEILDQVLNEQEGDFDEPSRFAISWYRQHGYGTGTFGDANNLATAKNTTVSTMDRAGILTSRGGQVQLIKSCDLIWDYDIITDQLSSSWGLLHQLIKVFERDGITVAGDLLKTSMSRPDDISDTDLIKELSHLLFRIAENNGWPKDALSFNTFATSWPDILEAARTPAVPLASQGSLDFNEVDN